MNTIFLKVLVILGLIAPVCADAAYKRVDSPGVAQRKLNLLLKDVRAMTDNQKKQALADLSPSLREDYNDMVKIAKNKKDFESAMFVLVTAFKDINAESQEVIDLIFGNIKDNYNLTNAQNDQLKRIARQMQSKSIESGGSTSDIVVKKEDTKEKLSLFLNALKEYFDKQLKDDVSYYKVTHLVSGTGNRFMTNVDDYTEYAKNVNDFFIELQKYQNQSSINYSIVCIQNAFSDRFFGCIDALYKKVMDSKKAEDINNLYFVMDKCNKILNTATYISGWSGGSVLILNKQEKSNNNKIIANTDAYKVFAEQFNNIAKMINITSSDKENKEEELDLIEENTEESHD